MNEKTVERMANTCNNYYSCALCPYNPEDISRFIGDKWIGGCPNYDRKLVYAMSKGYRKVPDGAVVLLIGKNNQALDEKTIEYFVKHNEQIRKETAREIIKEVKAFLDMQTKTVNELSNSNNRYAIPENCRDCYNGSQNNRIANLQRIAEKYGVEVEE